MLARFSIRTLSSSICRPFRLFSVAPNTAAKPETDEISEVTDQRIPSEETQKVARGRHFLRKRVHKPIPKEAEHLRDIFKSKKIDFQDTDLSLETPEY